MQGRPSGGCSSSSSSARPSWPSPSTEASYRAVSTPNTSCMPGMPSSSWLPCKEDEPMDDATTWTIGGRTLRSRLMIGSARYPSPDRMREAIVASTADVVTVSLRRENPKIRAGQAFWAYVRELGLHVLPNTAGCHSVHEAVTTAHMAREVFDTPWIKLELIGDDYTLQPDPFALVEAAERLNAEGFVVFPFMTDDLVLAKRLVDVGCDILMPWASPIGSGRGVVDPITLEL